MAAEPPAQPQQIAAAVQEVSDRAQVLIREEIELARAELTVKVKRLARGAAIGAIAGVFVLAALVLVLLGFAWLMYWVLPGGEFEYFIGFFVAGAILLIVGAIAGAIAARLIKSGSPPKPEMAIEEAQKIRQTVQG